jgi:hypothetical protein
MAWWERAGMLRGIAGEMPVDGPAMIGGHIASQGRLLRAPLSGKPCVAFTPTRSMLLSVGLDYSDEQRPLFTRVNEL